MLNESFADKSKMVSGTIETACEIPANENNADRPEDMTCRRIIGQCFVKTHDTDKCGANPDQPKQTAK